jgi:hypothetical protein
MPILATFPNTSKGLSPDVVFIKDQKSRPVIGGFSITEYQPLF